ERAVELVGRHALLGRAEQIGGQEPLGKRDLGALKASAHGHGELLTAVLALEQALAVGRAFEPVVIAYGAAVGADGFAVPADLFQVLPGGIVIVEVGGVGGVHGFFSY